MLKGPDRNEKGLAPRRSSLFFMFALLFFFLFPASSPAAEIIPRPEIKNIQLNSCQDKLCVSFELAGGLTPGIEKILQSGIPIKYLFEISLKKKRLLWDNELKHLELARTIVLDNIRDEYVLSFYYPSTRIITVSSLHDALEYLFSVRNLPIVSLERLSKGERYFLEIKASAKKGESSMPFGRLVKLFSSFGFSTDSYEIEFRY